MMFSGLRCVVPYVYEFKTFAKQRWYGREILEVFCTEFGAYSPDYYVRAVLLFWCFAIYSCHLIPPQERAISLGTISVNSGKVEPSYQIRNGDQIIHKVCTVIFVRLMLL